MAEIRKQIELDNPKTYNYYLAFSINPKEKDPKKIEEALKKQKNNWAQGNAEMRRYNELYQDIVNVMVNDLSYDASAQSYTVSGARAKELAAAKKYKIETAAKAIALSSGGLVYKSTYKAYKKKEKYEWYTEDELEAAIKQQVQGQGVKFIDDTQNLIDFSKYKDIDSQLRTVNKDTIYELLNDSSPKNTPAELCAEAVVVYRANNGKTTAVATASASLAGLAQKIFANDESKKKYEDFLASRKKVWDEMETVSIAGGDSVDVSKYEEWVNSIISILGMDKDTAEKYIAAGLRNYHLSVSGIQGKMTLKECPHPECGKLYYYDEKAPAKVCPHCRGSLVERCWNCNGEMDVKRSDCPVCGATKADKAVFEKALSVMETTEKSTGATLDALDKALDALKSCVPDYKKKQCKVKDKVDYYEPIVKARRDKEVQFGNAYRDAVTKINSEKLLKNYMKARSMAEELKTKFSSYKLKETLALISEIDVEINKAKAIVLKATTEKNKNNKEKALEYACEALEACRDYVEAREIIKHIPPDAPTNVRVSTFAGTATVEWGMPSDLHQTTYTVLKKIGTPPTNHTDGTELKKGMVINTCEDEDIVSATSYYYAVYAERLGVRSTLVQASGSVLVYNDISGVKQDFVEGKISATWKTPDNVKTIEVWKNDGAIAPSKPGEGEKLTTVTKNSFSDTTGTHCSYRIFCVYEMNGKTVYSKGVTRTFKRYEMLKPVSGATITGRADGGFNLNCQAPAVGDLGVLYSENRLSASLDTLFLRSAFTTECKGAQQATVSKDINGKLTFSIPSNKVVWAYPMVSNEQLFVLSAPTLINTVSGVGNLEFTKAAGSVHVKGVADKSATNVIFKVSERAFAQGMSDDGDVITIDAAVFNKSGATIHLKEDSNSYISVMTEFKKNGQASYTNAVPISNAPIANLRGKRVLYAVEAKPNINKPFKVKIKFSCAEPVTIPELCVKKGIPRPRLKSQGDLVEKTQPIDLKQGFLRKDYTGEIVITSAPCPSSVQFAVFVNDDDCTHIALNGTNKL